MTADQTIQPPDPPTLAIDAPDGTRLVEVQAATGDVNIPHPERMTEAAQIFWREVRRIAGLPADRPDTPDREARERAAEIAGTLVAAWHAEAEGDARWPELAKIGARALTALPAPVQRGDADLRAEAFREAAGIVADCDRQGLGLGAAERALLREADLLAASPAGGDGNE